MSEDNSQAPASAQGGRKASTQARDRPLRWVRFERGERAEVRESCSILDNVDTYVSSQIGVDLNFKIGH